MGKVIHMMRWFLPPTASFIRNQVMYHQRYAPQVVYLQTRAGAFQREIAGQHPTYNPFRGRVERWLYERGRWLSPAVRRRLAEHLRVERPDVLHVHYGVDALVYADVLRRLAIPACVSFYGYDCTSFPKRFAGHGQRLLQRKVFQNPAVRAVLAMTEDMRADLLRIGCPAGKIIVHYYGTETGPFFQDAPRRAEGKVHILILSGLQEKKGHVYLLRAFDQARQASSVPLHLDIVGDGPSRGQIERTIRELGLQDVTLHGAIPYGSEVHHDLLRRAHIFAHPSVTAPGGDKEGIPGALIEAMAAGLPVVSTHHAGIPYVLEHERTGLLVGERDVPALARALQDLAEDPGLRRSLGLAGQRHAREALDITHKEKELESIYDALQGGQKGG